MEWLILITAAGLVGVALYKAYDWGVEAGRKKQPPKIWQVGFAKGEEKGRKEGVVTGVERGLLAGTILGGQKAMAILRADIPELVQDPRYQDLWNDIDNDIRNLNNMGFSSIISDRPEKDLNSDT
jgi:hypothetical protein